MAPRRRIVSRPLKNRYAWATSTGSTGGLAAGVTALQFSVTGLQQTTMVRMRGEVSGYVDGAVSPGSGTQVTYGIILVPVGSATTVQYNPVDDDNAPWLLYGMAFLGYEEAVTDVVSTSGIQSFRHVIDNKAMRILRPEQEMQIVFESTTVFTALAVNLSYSIRWLQQTGKR